MKAKLIFITFVAALGGFLFGFDTAVISGTDPFVVPFFHLNDADWGLTVSSGLFGTIIGAAIAGFPANALGRRTSLFITGILYFFCSLGCALAPTWFVLVLSRFIGGIGVGMASVLSPMYIAELAPAKIRGQLVAVAQLNIVIGILTAYFSNKYFVTFENNWRFMFGAMAVPSLLFIILLFFVPNSPRWLVGKGRDEEALKVLNDVYRDPSECDTVLGEIKESFKEKTAPFMMLFDKKYNHKTLLAFLIATFNQLTGINCFIYYAPRILEKTGMSTEEALWQTFVAIGVTNLICTILAMFVIDKFGRKTLMWIGSFGLLISLTAMSIGFSLPTFGKLEILLSLILFIASFAFSQGAVVWVFLSEIFPNELRSHGQSLGSFTHWAWNCAITYAFPVVMAKIGGTNVFGFFAAMMVLQILFVWRMMPETKGKSLEALGKEVVVFH